MNIKCAMVAPWLFGGLASKDVVSDSSSNAPERCGNCRYLKKEEPYGLYCRRYPESIFINEPNPELGRDGYWKSPRVEINGWCGEYKPKVSN